MFRIIAQIWYTEYLGDDDTKSYHDVVSSKPYDDIPVMKLECIGHIQKRVGARLLKMKKNGDFKELYGDDDEDSNSKKRKKKRSLRLTDKDINKLQNYYGTVWNLKEEVDSCSLLSLLGSNNFGATSSILPKIMNLSSDELLTKCLHGKTQNNNESLNVCVRRTYMLAEQR